MGVPVLTLAGSYHAGRVGSSLLQAADLADWGSETPAAFVENAVARAADVAALESMRSTLRERLLASGLCNQQDFTRHLEDAYRRMWCEWLN